jgi:hypothetical protein
MRIDANRRGSGGKSSGAVARTQAKKSGLQLQGPGRIAQDMLTNATCLQEEVELSEKLAEYS